MMEASSEVTRLLEALDDGDPDALERLVPLIYDDLHRIARSRMAREAEGHTLSATAVVHEAFLRLARQEGAWKNRAHFFAVASRVMRHVLVDHARARASDKRGGDPVHVPLSSELGSSTELRLSSEPEMDLLAVNEALERLTRHDARLGRVVECRFFAGLSMEETAEALGVSVRTATRDWRRARAYLLEMLES